MQRVCDIITNCCCESTDKITQQLNTEVETQLRNQILKQCTNNLEITQNNIPSYNNNQVTRNNACDIGEHITQTGTRPMRKIFTSKSQAHKEGTNTPYDSQNQSKQQEQSIKMTGNETPDMQAQEYMNIAGYQNYRRVQDNANIRLPAPDKQHYNVHQQQQPGYYEYQNTNKVTRSRFNPLNMCCSCCCEVADIDPVQRSILHDNNRAIILKPIRRERIVEVMVEEIQERVINVPQIQYVDKYVEVPKPIFQYKIREVKRPVIVEKIVKVDKIVEEDKIIEVPEIQYVDKEVNVPQIVKKERIVEVPLPIVRERRIPILKLRKNEIFQEVDNVNYNEFGINLTALRRDGTDVHSAPNNTPINRDDTENIITTEQQGNMQLLQNDRAIYEGSNNAEAEEKSTKSGTLVALEQPRIYAENESSENSRVFQPMQTENVAQSMSKVTRGVTTYEQSVAETCLNIYGVSNKSVGRSITQEVPADKKDSLTVMEIFTEREAQNEDVLNNRNSYDDDNARQTAAEGGEIGDLVSIYPNINALSLRSTPVHDEATENYMKQLAHDTQNMTMSLHHSNSPSEGSQTHIHMTSDAVPTALELHVQMQNQQNASNRPSRIPRSYRK